MKAHHRLSALKDKFYNFCFKDSLVLKQTSKQRLRFYLILGVLCLIGISFYSVLWEKKPSKPSELPRPATVIEPVVTEPKVPVAVVVEPIVPSPVPAVTAHAPAAVEAAHIPALEEQEKDLDEPTGEEGQDNQEKEHEIKKEPMPLETAVPVKEKPKSIIERTSKGDHEIDVLYQKAISFVKHKKFDQARSILQRDDIIRHSHGKALNMLVKILLNDRSYEMVETYAKKYLDLYPSEKTEVLLAYGHALSGLQRYQELLRALGGYVPSSEKREEYNKLLGQAYLKEKKYPEAREIYERLLENNDNDTKLLMALLISQIGMKDNDAAQITMGKLYQNPLDARETQALKKMAKLIVTEE
jgi:tetratricopeptide (TPR) repeat protein